MHECDQGNNTTMEYLLDHYHGFIYAGSSKPRE